jgi:hypothetical protein
MSTESKEIYLISDYFSWTNKTNNTGTEFWRNIMNKGEKQSFSNHLGYSWHIVKSFVNAKIYLQHNKKYKIKKRYFSRIINILQTIVA